MSRALSLRPPAPPSSPAWAPAACIAVVTMLVGASCGDDRSAALRPDAGSAGEPPPPPPPPRLGEMLDRRGRPMVAELIVTGTIRPGDARDAARAAYEHAPPEAWPGFLDAVESALALYDALDSTAAGGGCGSHGLGAPRSYRQLAELLVDDRLYLDTDLGSCRSYLALERARATGVPTPDCGGHAPRYDVIDATYTMLISGLPEPLVSDGVPAHEDTSQEFFPFLGAAPP